MWLTSASVAALVLLQLLVQFGLLEFMSEMKISSQTGNL